MFIGSYPKQRSQDSRIPRHPENPGISIAVFLPLS
jgi:hypothetical protein